MMSHPVLIISKNFLASLLENPGEESHLDAQQGALILFNQVE
jgi:hypothetical protein